MRDVRRREIVAWSLFDFANSSFTTLMVTFIFGRFFVEAIVGDEVAGTRLWTWAINLSAVVVALSMPVLGAVADAAGRKKTLLAVFTATTVLFTALLFFTGPGTVWPAFVFFVVANVGFEGGSALYNAFLPEITDRRTIGRVSGLGWGLGYIGGLLCLAVGLGMIRGWLPDEGFLDVRATTLLVAGWFGVFSLPLFLFLRERAPRRRVALGGAVAAGARQVARTFRRIRDYGEAAKMLLARLIYNDGLTTLFAMSSIYAGAALGIPLEEFLVLAIVINLAAGVGAAAFGFVDDRIGGKRTVALSLFFLILATLLGSLARRDAVFWVAGVLIGIMVGPNQSASRSLLARMVPEHQHGEFFGFFAFSGKLSSIMGPLTYGSVVVFTGSHRAAMASILIFFVAGLMILGFVREAEGIAEAERLTAEHRARKGALTAEG